MSTEILNLEGGPLTTNNLDVVRYCCAKSVVDKGYASNCKSIQLMISEPGALLEGKAISLTYNQAIILAESILEALK